MIQDCYRILGVDENVSDEQLDAAYKSLRARYRDLSFSGGAGANDAAQKINELDKAYEEIINYRREHSSSSNENLYKQVDAAIKKNDLERAQALLDSFNERPAEWHYLQAVIFYQKNWMNESRKQLEIAKEMEPDNEKYKTTYEKLVAKMTNDDNAHRGADAGWNRSGSGGGAGGYTTDGGGYDEPQMGGEGCFNYCCQVCMCNMLLNCCCNSCR